LAGALKPFRDQARGATLPLYLGGFMGPFGGAVLAVLIPELRAAFHTSTGEVALAIPAYLVPFAALQVGSGTIGERLGRRRAVRAAYAVYAVALIGSAVAPTIGVFLVTRAIQGAANAFTSPLLLAGLADAVAPDRRGRAVGTFAGVQAAGVSLAPLLGGLAGAVSWRLAFIAPAVVALGLILVPPPEPSTRATRVSFRSVFTPRMGLLSAAGFAGYLGMTGLTFLVSLRADDAFGVGSTGRGVLLAAFGAAGMVFGRYGGHRSEQLGPARAAAVAAFGCAAAVAPLGVAPSALALGVLWFCAGALSALLWAGLNTLALEAVPANRGGAVSLFAAAKFSGTAVAPLILLPVYHRSPAAAFVCAALVVLMIAPLAKAASG
jgi:MFS family permease